MVQDYIERIKKLKSARGLTAEDLAGMTGIPVSTLSKMLAGCSESVKLSNLVAICNALDVSIDYIVSGTPENTNNFTLNADEIRLVDGYRRLDRFGRDFVHTVIEKETERIAAIPSGRGFSADKTSGRSFSPYERSDVSPSDIRHIPSGDIIIGGKSGRFEETDAIRRPKIQIPCYDMAVSAGPGEYLDGDDSGKTIGIADSELARRASYAVRINGNSMEPAYKNGDILLVEAVESVSEGELGIFVLDGCGYFKKFGGDRLISLNSDYGPIMLKDYSSSSCRGRVLGKLKKSNRKGC